MMRGGRSGLGLGSDPGCKAVDREAVTVDTETAKRCESRSGSEGVMTETLARVDIADVYFDRRNFRRY